MSPNSSGPNGPHDLPPRSCRAPGKLLLFGEYAALGAGWSVVAAVDRHVVAMRRTPVPGHLALPYQALGVPEQDARALPACVLDALGLGEEALLGVETNALALFEGSEKLGLGSSAASTVALTALLMNPGGGPEAVFGRAHAAHRALQGGRGSGVDVAAAAFGGIRGYRLNRPTPPFPALSEAGIPGPTGEVEDLGEASITGRLALPEGLAVRAVWTGQAASSTALIRAVEAGLARDPAGVTGALEALGNIAACAIALMQPGAAPRDRRAGLLELFREADAGLETLDALCQAGIITARHRALRAACAPFGLVAKPSGAGGGDFSLVAGPADTNWAALQDALPQGCQLLALAFGVAGACEG